MVVVEEMAWHCGMGIINGGIKELIYTPLPFLIYENPNNARYTSDFPLKQLSLFYFRISVLLSFLLFLVFAFVFRT